MTKDSIWTMVPLVKLKEKQARIWVSDARIWVLETNFLVSEARI